MFTSAFHEIGYGQRLRVLARMLAAPERRSGPASPAKRTEGGRTNG